MTRLPLAGGRVQHAAWWVLVSGTVAGVALSLVLRQWYFSDEFVGLTFLCYGFVGALVARRRPENPIGWIFLLVGLLSSLGFAAASAGQWILDADPQIPWSGTLSAWYNTWFWYALVMLATTFTLLLFPSGLPSPRWRPVLRLAVTATLAMTLFEMMSPTLELGRTAGNQPVMIANPLSPSFLAGVDLESTWWFLTTGAIALLCGIAAIGSAVLRSRRAVGVEREQMRLFGFASLSLPVLFVLSNAVPLGAVVRNAIFAAALAGIPLACGVAIMRYRLYDIDRIIGRTTAYGMVTGVLLAVYAAVVTTVSQLLPESGDLAIAAATLSAAAAFRPVLAWAQRLVDRRFNRSRFDAAHEVDAFAARLRHSVDADATAADLSGVVGRTLQPVAMGMWTKGDSL